MKKIFFLLLFCFLLVNAGADDFDFTKKGNVYEKTFRIPFDLWRSALKVEFCIETTQTRLIQDTSVIEHETEWTKNLYYLWRGDLEFCEKEKDPQECFERMEKLAQEEIKDLEAYHPNQYFKFKITFMPFNEPEKKQEKITNIPLYHKTMTLKDYFTYGDPYGNKCVGVSFAPTTIWRKYYVKIEVLEDMSFPSEIDIFKVYIYSPSRKP